MPSTTAWLKAWIYFGCISGWTAGARPQFDTSTNMGLVLVPADAEVDSVIFRLRATDQDADFPLVFDITAAVQPIVRIANLPCTLYNKVCQANVILTRRLVPGRLHDFAVRVRDSKGDTNSMQATISVTNASTPRDMIFPHVPAIIMVPEDTKPGKELDYLLVRANPWHGKPVYIELWQPKELFTIRQRQTPTQTRGVIILEGELDFETQSMYTLTMYATDPYTEVGKDTRNIAGVHVVVIVQDVQDVPPVFTIAPPLTRVNNSVKPGDVILRVHAEDGDKGTPREVTYGLVSEGNPFTPFFNISEWTGEIILTRPLEELTQITHVGAPILLTVVAEEVRRSREEPPGQATVVELGLLLGEPGNSPPYFDSDSYMAWMDENAAPGTVVMFDKPDLTKVRDEDIGKTGVFALKLGNNNGTFEVTPAVAERVANFVVTVRDNSLMDYEVRKTLQFMIIAQEVGPATNLSTSVPVTIFLRDINDNPPQFEKETYEVTLAENVSPGTRVIQVHASDKDTGLSGSVRYTRILGPGSETLTMDSDTGMIVVAKDSSGLDREITPSLQLSVEACDENGRGLRSTVPLIVHLLDVNDNAPIFDKSVYEFVLNSDQTNFTSPAFIKAIDADAEPPNNEVRYELVHGNYGNKFHLNEVTGELILREPLNKSRRRRNDAYDHFATRFRSDFLQTLNTFQKIGVSTDKPLRIWKNRKKRAAEDVLYTLTVRAYDSGVPHRSSTAKVNIITAAPVGALTLMLVVPAEHLDPVRTTETLAAITGGRVTIQEIRPYDQPGGTAQGGKMSIVVARVEPTMSGTFLVDVETIHKSLVANGMGIVPVTNSANETPVSVTVRNTVGNGNGGTGGGTIGENGGNGGNGNAGESPGGTDGNNGGNPVNGNVNGVNIGNGKGTGGPGESTDDGTGKGTSGTQEGTKTGTGKDTKGTGGGANGGTGEGNEGKGGNTGNKDPGTTIVDTNGGTNVDASSNSGGSTGKGNAIGPGGGTVGGSGKESVENGGENTSGGTGGGIANNGGTAGGTTGVEAGESDGSTVGGKEGSIPIGTSGGTAGTISGGTNGGTAGGASGGSGGDPGKGTAGGAVSGNNDKTGVKVEETFTKINKTVSTSENEYIVYKAENKLLLWLLILLGLLMLLALLALILCCICPGCPFYMAPRKRRVHSFESVNHPDARPKRHLRRKQFNPVKAEWSGKKQAWSADPMRRNWQFNRRNTKNRGLASLPGDVVRIESPQALPTGPALRLRDGPESWGVQYPIQKRKEDRIHVEDVEAGRMYDTEDVDSLRRHEMERGSDVPRHNYRQGDETSRLPREQHFYRDGNAEVLRLVTGGHIEGEETSIQAQRPTTLVSDHQTLGYRSDGKDILLRRFIEDQKIRQHQDLHSSVQEISVDGLESRRQGSDQFLQKHEVIILPRNLELDRRQHREETAPSVQRLIIDHGEIDHEEELRARNHQLETQEADLRQQRKMAAAMLVGTAVSRATEKPTTNVRTLVVEQNASALNIPTYTIHDVELAKQNALLTQLLMDRDVRHLGVPGMDPGSYLETQSLPGQVAIATQTDRTAATQTENRSRSDNEESEEEIRSRRKSKSKNRFGSELRRSRSLWLRSPIQEESRSVSGTRNSLLRRKVKDSREGRRAAIEPEVLREISDSLDEQASTPSIEEEQIGDRRTRVMKSSEYQSQEREAEDAELSENLNRSSPEMSKDKYHRRSHAKAVIGEVLQAQKLESGTGKQSSPGKSKTKSQKTAETKSADGKKVSSTNSDKKESDTTSTDAKSNPKKRSTESQSNNGGVKAKKEIEDKRKILSKLVSKVGGLGKSASEKSVKKNKFRETEEAPIVKKRSMLRRQKVKKISTESSEFEEIPVKPRQSGSKAEPPKQTESTSGINSKQDPARGKETSTLSDEPKSRSSGTDRDRLPKRYQKLSDSTSSSATPGHPIVKKESTSAVKSGVEDKKEDVKHGKKTAEGLAQTQSEHELIKLPSSTVLIDRKLTSGGARIEDELREDRQSIVEAVSDKREGSLPQLESEVLKSSTVLTGDQLEPRTKDEPKISVGDSNKSGEASPGADSEVLNPGDGSLSKKEGGESEGEGLLKIGTEISEQIEKSGASESGKNTQLIGEKLEPGIAGVSETTEKISDNLDPPTTTLVPGVLESDEKKLTVQDEPEAPFEGVAETKDIIAEELKKVDPDVSKSSMDFLSLEKQSESSIGEILPAGEKSQHELEEIPPKSDSGAEEAEKQPELSTKEVTAAFLESEAMHSSKDSQVAVVEAEDHPAPGTTMTAPATSVTPDPVDVSQRDSVKQDTSDGTNLVAEKIDDVKTGSTGAEVDSIDASAPDARDSKDIGSPVKSGHEQSDSFIIIEHPEERDDPTSPIVSKPDGEKRSDVIGASGGHQKTESRTESPNNEKKEGEELKLAEGKSGKSSADPLEAGQRLADKSPTPRYKSIDQSEIELPVVKEREEARGAGDHPLSREVAEGNTDRKSPEKESNPTSEEGNFPTTGSPSFYILSSGSSAEDFVPDQGTSDSRINPGQPSPEYETTLVPDISKFPTTAGTRLQQSGERRSEDTRDDLIAGQTHSKPMDLADMRSGEWDTRHIQIGDVSSDSPDNAQPYQTPRHRSKNRTGNAGESAGRKDLSESDQSPELKKIVGADRSSDERPGISPAKIKDEQLTPKLIAEEAIRSGLREIIDSDAMKRDSSSQTSSKTSPENQSQRREPSKRRPGKEASRIPTATEAKKSGWEKTGNGSQSSKKIEEAQEGTRSARPKTEPKGGNPKEEDTHQVRPRTQRGKASKPQDVPLQEPRQEAAIRRPKVAERNRQVKQNAEEIKPQDSSHPKSEDGAIPKEGYMSRYKQKREEMERRRKELKEAAEEEQRPRWQRKPAVIPPQRVSGKESSKKEKPTDAKTPEGATPRTRRRIKPLANAESEQLRAMVKEGRKQRRAEGGDSDDPTVEIFATEPPAKIAAPFHPAAQKSSYKYEPIPLPFYLHPPPPPHSSPQVSPLHMGPVDPRRPDDDLDSGIAVSLQGGTKLRHQQLLDKKSVFDIAYSEAAPSQLRTDSTTPPS